MYEYTSKTLVITFLHLYFLLVKQIWSSNFLLSILDRRHKRRINRYFIEVNRLSLLGGGVGVGVGIRTSDNKSTGVMSHLNTYDACSLAYKQDRGS